MSMVDDIIPEGAEPSDEPVDEAPAEAPLASQEPEAPEAAEVEAAEPEQTPAEEAWIAAARAAGLGSYIDEAGGDPLKLVERLHGLRQQLSRGEQDAPAPPEPEPAPELMVGDIVWPPESIPELYQAAQNPEFAGQAAIWAMENRHRIPQNVLNEIVNNWWYVNPAQAQSYQNRQQWNELREEILSQVRPVQEHTAKTVSDAAQSLAQQQIDARVPGDWNKYRARIAEVCNDPQASSFFFRHGETPEGLAQGIRDAYGWIKQQEWLQQGGQAPQAAPVATPATPPAAGDDRPRDEHGRFAATTSGRGSAPSRTPTKDEELVDAIIGV